MTRTRAHTDDARRSRAAFTLVEVITAITLTAIVLTMASAALGAATTARERVATHQQTLESESRLHAMLTDMLRHAPEPQGEQTPLLQIEQRTSSQSRLEFLSTGVREPFGTGAPWRVSVAADERGLTLDAVPLTLAGVVDASGVALHTRVPSVRGLEVRVRETGREGDPSAWRTDWPDALARPALVELRLTRANASRPTSPMTIVLDPLAVPR